jgi:SAM-dependent methyltransferase
METNNEIFTELKDKYLVDRVYRDYFDSHLPRFDLSLNVFREFLADKDIKTVADIGSWFPFASIYFKKTKNSDVWCFSLEIKEPYHKDGVSFNYLNLNRPDDIGTFDLVILTECLEHLPSSELRALMFAWFSVKNGGHLFVSFPCGGINSVGHEKDLINYDWGIPHAHIREFTPEVADHFVSLLGGKVLSRSAIKTQAYQADMLHFLIQKVPLC